MNFGAPITRVAKQDYSEAPNVRGLSSRDGRLVGKQWLKARAEQSQNQSIARVISKLQQDMQKVKHRVIGMPPSQAMFPFKIYQEPNISATDAQRKQFTDLGVDISNYTCQIRSGTIGFRPTLTAPNSTWGTLAYGNSEMLIYCPNTDSQNPFSGAFSEDYYYQPSPNKGTTIIIDDKLDTLICGLAKGSAPGAPGTYANQIALNPIIEGSDQFGNNTATFWIEIIDEQYDGVNPGNGLYANLMARMVANDPPDQRQTIYFPDGPNIFPIGVFAMSANFTTSDGLPFVPSIEQLQGENLVNRFPPIAGNNLGKWSDLFGNLPAGATNFTFYPGDIVIVTNQTIQTAGGGIGAVINAHPIMMRSMTQPVQAWQTCVSMDNIWYQQPNWMVVGLFPT